MTAKIKRSVTELHINKIYTERTISRIIAEEENCKAIYTNPEDIDFCFNWGHQKVKLKQIFKGCEEIKNENKGTIMEGEDITYLILEPIKIKEYI